MPPTNFSFFKKTSLADAKYSSLKPSQAKPTVQTQKSSRLSLPSTSSKIQIALGLVVVTFITRIFRFNQPNAALPDETSVLEAMKRYEQNSFYLDSEPPLGKLVFFFIHSIYSSLFPNFVEAESIAFDQLPYGRLRVISTWFGSLLPALGYLTCTSLNISNKASLLSGIFIAFEVAFSTQSRFIFLDSQILLYIGLSLFSWCQFSLAENRPFSQRWYTWLLLAGLFVGMSASTRWAGIHTYLLFNLYALLHVWNRLADLSLSLKSWCKYASTILLCIAIIPCIVYILSFYFHLSILSNFSKAAIATSPQFRISLLGHPYVPTYSDVIYGANITLFHVGTNGGFLHSHSSFYPQGSKQQQVSCYPYRDHNNIWSIHRKKNDGDNRIDFVKDGDVIRLFHESTQKRLHSHDVRPCFNEKKHQNEVSAYGSQNFSGDSNDFWRIIIYKNSTESPDHSGRIISRRTLFRLQHVNRGCYLFSHHSQLPKWGFFQQEVTCGENAQLENSLWIVEDSNHRSCKQNYILSKVLTKVKNLDDIHYSTLTYTPLTFLEKFKEIHKILLGEDKEPPTQHISQSSPSSWMFLQKGVLLWKSNNSKLYLLGNPFSWYLGTLSIMCGGALLMFGIVQRRRMMAPLVPERQEKMVLLLLSSWAGHFLPYWFYGQRVFLYHYLPSLYISLLLVGVLFDLLFCGVSHFSSQSVLIGLCGISIYYYFQLLPFFIGWELSKEGCDRRKLIPSWEIDCTIPSMKKGSPL